MYQSVDSENNSRMQGHMLHEVELVCRLLPDIVWSHSNQARNLNPTMELLEIYARYTSGRFGYHSCAPLNTKAGWWQGRRRLIKIIRNRENKTVNYGAQPLKFITTPRYPKPPSSIGAQARLRIARTYASYEPMHHELLATVIYAAHTSSQSVLYDDDWGIVPYFWMIRRCEVKTSM